ncbi:kinase-like protein [Sesbania bispinosa]|nr:kinase-like protein [Sesbania bispinosa]
MTSLLSIASTLNSFLNHQSTTSHGPPSMPQQGSHEPQCLNRQPLVAHPKPKPYHISVALSLPKFFTIVRSYPEILLEVVGI